LVREREDLLVAYALLTNAIAPENDPGMAEKQVAALSVLRSRAATFERGVPSEEELRNADQLAELLIRMSRFSDADQVLNQLQRRVLRAEPCPVDVHSTLDRLNKLAERMGRPKLQLNRYYKVPVDTFIGRTHELQDLLDKVVEFDGTSSDVRSHTQLTAVWGPPGIGKTRLLRELYQHSEVQRAFGAAKSWVQVQPEADADQLVRDLMSMFGVIDGREPLPQISRRIRELSLEARKDGARGRFLLIVDGANDAETVSRSTDQNSLCTRLRQLLECTDELVLVLSSRAAVSRPWSLVGIPPLSANLSRKLFRIRAEEGGLILTKVHDVDTNIDRICRDAAGIPMLIEIQAPRLVDTSLSQVSFASVDSDLSWQEKVVSFASALSAEQRKLLSNWAVFHGGWNFDGAVTIAHSVAGLSRTEVESGLRQLIRSALVQADFSEVEPRYFMLDPIREVVADHFQEHAAELRSAHLSWITQYVEAVLESSIPDMKSAIERELPNLRAALNFALSRNVCGQSSDALRGTNLIIDLFPFWHDAGYHIEGQHWCTESIGFLRNSAEIDPEAKEALAQLLRIQGVLYRDSSDYARAESCVKEALVLAETMGDRQLRARCLRALGNFAQEQGQYTVCREYQEQALSLYDGDHHTIEYIHSLNNLATACEKTGDFGRAKDLLSEAIEVADQMKDDIAIGLSHMNYGNLLYVGSQFEAALDEYEEALSCFDRCQQVSHMGECLHNLANVYYALESDKSARQFAERARRYREEMQHHPLLASTYHLLGAIEYHAGDNGAAAEHYAHALELSEQFNDNETEALTIEFAARLLACTHHFREAALCWGRSETLYRELTVEVDHVPRDAEDHGAKRSIVAEALGSEQLETLILQGADVRTSRVVQWLRRAGRPVE
jgi:tetratricopeptide (TPR) repeat protein